MPDPLPSRLAPVLVLVAVVVLGVLAWRFFPLVQGWAAAQSCIASGHTNCG